MRSCYGRRPPFDRRQPCKPMLLLHLPASCAPATRLKVTNDKARLWFESFLPLRAPVPQAPSLLVRCTARPLGPAQVAHHREELGIDVLVKAHVCRCAKGAGEQLRAGLIRHRSPEGILTRHLPRPFPLPRSRPLFRQVCGQARSSLLAPVAWRNSPVLPSDSRPADPIAPDTQQARDHDRSRCAS